MSKIITARFQDKTSAQEALHRLENLGVTEDQVSMILSETTHGEIVEEKETKSEEGIVAGGIAGGLVGAVIAAVLSAGALAVPAAGIVISGWLVSAAAGMGAGMAAGGVIGGLIGAGIPEDEAKLHEDAVRQGAVLLAVKPENETQAETIRSTFTQSQAQNIAA